MASWGSIFTEDFLRREFVERKRTRKEIANDFPNCSHRIVDHYINKFKILTPELREEAKRSRIKKCREKVKVRASESFLLKSIQIGYNKLGRVPTYKEISEFCKPFNPIVQKLNENYYIVKW